MATNTRRRVRTAPVERPIMELSDHLIASIKEISRAVSGKILSAFENGECPGTPEAFQNLEGKLLEVCGKELVAPVIGEVLQEIHGNEDFVLWAMGSVRRQAKLVSKGDKTARVRVAGGGIVEVASPHMGPDASRGRRPARKRGGRRKGNAGLFPVLAVLGFLARVSPYLASAIARTSARLDSYEETKETLEAQGIRLSVNTVRSVVTRVGNAGLVARERGDDIDPEAFAGKRVVICIDGGRVRYRLEKPGRPRKNGRHGYDTPWREPKVVAIYTVDKNGKKTKKEKPIYEGTLAPWQDASDLIVATLHQNGIEKAKSVTIAADGSNTIWDKIDEILEVLDLDRKKVFLFVDFYHALEHLHDAAKLDGSMDEARRKRWVKKQAKRLKNGGVEKVIAALEALPASDGEALAKEVNYFRNRTELMRYDRLLSRKLPIGTGAVESAIRRVVNLRLKGAGTFWLPENAERMLYLRCRLKAGRWRDVERAMYAAALVPERNLKPQCLKKLVA